jgi:hypothetical protein
MIHTFVEPPADYYFQDDVAQPPQVPTALEKTRMCLYFLQGRCKYTDCSFAHSHDELKQAPVNLRKTKMCELFLAGCCPNDLDCNFAHSMDELKLRSKRSMSTSLSPTYATSSMAACNEPSIAVTPHPSANQNSQPNSEFCARTILSMLIKMQPEAAVAFLSNPECKVMLERLLDEKSSASAATTPPPSTTASSSSAQSVGILTPQLARDSNSFFSEEPLSSFNPFDVLNY